MDKILKIYDGSGTGYDGSGSLLYTIKSNMVDYNFVDNNTYIIDKFEALLLGNNLYDIDIHDIWRIYAEDGTWLGGGRIVHKPVTTNDNLKIVCEGWIGIFKDREVDRTQTDGDGGDDIIKDILTTDYSDYTFDVTGVATPTNTFGQKKFKGLYAYDVIKWCCDNSYGANNRNFNIRIHEVAGSEGTLYVSFFESETSSTGVTIYPQDINIDSVDLTQRGDINANKVVVYGAVSDFNSCPINKDFWTEYTNDTDVQDVWTTTDCNAESSTNFNSVGTYSVYMDIDDGVNSALMQLNLDDADAFNATQTPTELFTSGSGFKFDPTKDQWLTFKILADSSLAGELDGGTCDFVRLDIVDEDGDSGEIKIFVNSGRTDASIHNVPTGDKWYIVDVKLNDFVKEEADFVQEIEINVNYDGSGTAAGDDLYIDGLYFYEKTGRVKGSYTDGTTNEIVKIIYDDSIDGDWLANDVAEYYYNSQRIQYTGRLSLTEEINSLYAGGTANFRIPEYNVNLDDIVINTITRRPFDTILEIGRIKSVEEIITQISKEIRDKV